MAPPVERFQSAGLSAGLRKNGRFHKQTQLRKMSARPRLPKTAWLVRCCPNSNRVTGRPDREHSKTSLSGMRLFLWSALQRLACWNGPVSDSHVSRPSGPSSIPCSIYQIYHLGLSFKTRSPPNEDIDKNHVPSIPIPDYTMYSRGPRCNCRGRGLGLPGGLMTTLRSRAALATSGSGFPNFGRSYSHAHRGGVLCDPS